MINISEIIKIIRNQLNIEVYDFDVSYYSNNIYNMLQWYKGTGPDDFHTYTDTNGVEKITRTRAHLNMAKRVCEDHAGLAFNDNLVVNIDDNDVNNYLFGKEEVNGYLGPDFWTNMSGLYEITCALGTGAVELGIEGLKQCNDLIISNRNTTKIKLLYHNAMNIIPLTWDENRNIESVAFLHVVKEKDKISNSTYNKIYITIHNLTDHGYDIINKVIINKDSKYKLCDASDDIIDTYNTGSNIPLFRIIKLPIINNYDLYSPYGLSIYANGLSALESADMAFTTFKQEFDNAGKRIITDYSLLPTDERGNKIMDTTSLPYMFYTGYNREVQDYGAKAPFTEFNPEIRVESITQGVQTALNLISSTCGLGEHAYNFSSGVVKTATEVISENSSCYRNIKRNESALSKFMYELFKSIIYYSNKILGTGLNEEFNCSFMYDTAIVEDKTEDKKFDLELVKNNVMTIEEFRNKWFNIPRRSEDSSYIDDNKQ